MEKNQNCHSIPNRFYRFATGRFNLIELFRSLNTGSTMGALNNFSFKFDTPMLELGNRKGCSHFYFGPHLREDRLRIGSTATQNCMVNLLLRFIRRHERLSRIQWKWWSGVMFTKGSCLWSVIFMGYPYSFPWLKSGLISWEIWTTPLKISWTGSSALMYLNNWDSPLILISYYFHTTWKEDKDCVLGHPACWGDSAH